MATSFHDRRTALIQLINDATNNITPAMWAAWKENMFVPMLKMHCALSAKLPAEWMVALPQRKPLMGSMKFYFFKLCQVLHMSPIMTSAEYRDVLDSIPGIAFKLGIAREMKRTINGPRFRPDTDSKQGLKALIHNQLNTLAGNYKCSYSLLAGERPAFDADYMNGERIADAMIRRGMTDFALLILPGILHDNPRGDFSDKLRVVETILRAHVDTGEYPRHVQWHEILWDEPEWRRRWSE